MFNKAPQGNNWIQLRSGTAFDPFNPKVEDIHIEDIAHALSNICRFGGHCREFYSVSEHSYWVSLLVPPEHALQALLHDGSESFLLDVPTPFKRHESFLLYRETESRLQQLIYRRFGVSEIEHGCVKAADLEMLATEARDLLDPQHPEWRLPSGTEPSSIIRIHPMSPTEAREAFLSRFHALVAARDIEAENNNAPLETRSRILPVSASRR